MAQTYLFSKQSRDEAYEHDTSYCFKLRRGKGWMHLNRKATLIELNEEYIAIAKKRIEQEFGLFK